MTEVSIKDLRKSYGRVEVLKGINLDIEKGEFVVFVGPSGCGKSTLLRCIAGLEEITSGELEFDSETVNDLTPSQRGIAMVFQSYALYPHMTVYENMAYSLKLAKLPKTKINEKVLAAAEKLELTQYLDRKPSQLSGGQRQRVAIGRSIVRDPKLFLFDEPLSNLDAALRVQMRLEIAELSQQLEDTTMIYVTHDQVEAMTLADKIVVLNGGAIEQVGTPMELYDNPATEFVAGFIGSPKINMIGGEFANKLGAHKVGIRPEHLSIAPDGNFLCGQVLYTEQLGADIFVYLNTEFSDEPICVRSDRTLIPKQGQPLNLMADMEQMYAFDKTGRVVN